VAIPEVIHVARRAFFLPNVGYPSFNSPRFPRALKSFSKISFSFRGHNFTRAGSRRNDEAPN
jgi:hypothetical protein